MVRVFLLMLVAVLAGACVSSDNASNGAIRILHAVPDGPRINFTFNGLVGSLDYRTGSAYLAVVAGEYPVKIEEQLPSGSDPALKLVDEFSQPLAVNDEVTLVVVGQAADSTEDVVSINTTTRGVPTGAARVQVVHAAADGEELDFYLVAPDALIAASQPLQGGLAYKEFGPQSEIPAGFTRIWITPKGDQTTILFEQDIYLQPEGTFLFAIVRDASFDQPGPADCPTNGDPRAYLCDHPFSLVALTSGGSGTILDKDYPARLRLVNASPGSYTLDSFVNATAVSTVTDAPRQTCGSPPAGVETLLEECARAYEFVMPDFVELTPASYELKVQRSNAGDDDPAKPLAKSNPANLGAAAEVTAVITGLASDAATAETTEVTLQPVLATRRIATAAQLRVVDVSVAADAAIAGDPTTDRLDLTVTPVDANCVALDSVNRPPLVFSNISQGADTGYRSYRGGDYYQVTVTQVDTADADAEPLLLLSQRSLLPANGVFTLLIADSTGGVQPLKILSVDDDSSLADCPAPP